MFFHVGLLCLSTSARNTKVGQLEKGTTQTNAIFVHYTEAVSSAKLAPDYKCETIAYLRASKYSQQHILNSSRVSKQLRKSETQFSPL